MRFGEKKSFKVKLIEAPDQSQVATAEDPETQAQPAVATESRRFDKLGIAVEPVSPALATRARMSDLYRRGLMVSEVNVTGPARGKIFADNTILLQVLNPGAAPRAPLGSRPRCGALSTAEGRRRDVPRVRRAAGSAGPRLDARRLAGSRAVAARAAPLRRAVSG